MLYSKTSWLGWQVLWAALACPWRFIAGSFSCDCRRDFTSQMYLRQNRHLAFRHWNWAVLNNKYYGKLRLQLTHYASRISNVMLKHWVVAVWKNLSPGFGKLYHYQDLSYCCLHVLCHIIITKLGNIVMLCVKWALFYMETNCICCTVIYVLIHVYFLLNF